MPLTWDIAAALSDEVPLMAWLADRLSETAGFRRLNDESTAAAAREKIVMGPQNDPWETGKASKADLETILLRANIHPAADNSHEAREPQAASSCPDEGGTLEISIRRQIRDQEMFDLQDQGVYMAVTDCVSSIVHDLQQASILAQRVVKVRTSERVTFGSLDTRSAQGVYLWAMLEVDWGDRGDGQ